MARVITSFDPAWAFGFLTADKTYNTSGLEIVKFNARLRTPDAELLYILKLLYSGLPNNFFDAVSAPSWA